MLQEVTIKINYLDEKGYGVGFVNNQEYRILNSLPDEEVKAKIFKKKKGVRYGSAGEIIKSSEKRILSKEDHFLSCSPWQILDQEEELIQKKELIKSFYKKFASIELPNFDIQNSKNRFNYRNKVEFGFYGDSESEKLSLSFHKRDGNKAKYCVDGCVLLAEKMNFYANKILNILNKNKILARQLKGLLLRYSFYDDSVVAAIYSKDENIILSQSEFETLLDENLKGVLLIYSDRRSPAFVETKRIFTLGAEELLERINNCEFYFPYDGFFQINPSSFKFALEDIEHFINKNNKIIELYSGVGTIGIYLAKNINNLEHKLLGVESFEKSLEFATKNIKLNKIEEKYELIQEKSEDVVENLLKSYDTLIVDPPRSGLHPKVIKQILESKPQKIIYLSCNPKSQAQNFNELKENYDIIFFKAYNFYPATPHVESLLILERKNNVVR